MQLRSMTWTYDNPRVNDPPGGAGSYEQEIDILGLEVTVYVNQTKKEDIR